MKAEDTLINRDARGAIRTVHLYCNWSDELHAYAIERYTGILGKTITPQPILTVQRGKASRTVTEQASLEYNSLLKKYLDKGYKNIKDLGITELTVEAAEESLPKDNTDQNDVVKPQLCKVLDKTKPSQTEKHWYCSYKLDGVRCLLFMKDGEVHTASRGGQDYDVPATYIREDPYVIKIFEDNPGLMLDGEIYRHLWNLSYISGLCRRDDLTEKHEELCFYCYDIVDTTKPFKDRLSKLNELAANCPEDSKIKFLKHQDIFGLDAIMKHHNEAVENGYEGLVIRDPNKEYKPGARDSRMMKIKEFTDDEFLITGIAEGLRDEDMCFTMEMPDGTPFKAKPIGDRALKNWYREHINEIIGSMGTVKYFGMTNTEHPVPNLPSFRGIRLEKDLD